MHQPTTLAETFTKTAVRQEADDDDARTVLAETHTMTEVRQETSDPTEAGSILAVTQSLTKTNNETSDPDEGAFAGSLAWEAGDMRPLLFRAATLVTAPEVPLTYDVENDVALDASLRPLVADRAGRL